MPKNKTHCGASKRFKVTGSGKMLREQRRPAPPPGAQALQLTRQLAGTVVVAPADVKRVKKLLGK